MPRPVTLFTGQWADLPLEDLARKAVKIDLMIREDATIVKVIAIVIETHVINLKVMEEVLPLPHQVLKSHLVRRKMQQRLSKNIDNHELI
jgi:hypothetical protein